MPELPEVETIIRSLITPNGKNTENVRSGVIGRKISSAQLNWERTLATPSVIEFKERISGREIRSVRRRGKFIVIGLDEGALLIHLRMSGDIRFEPQSAPLLPHDRLILNFEDGLRLAFNDTRKFGRAWLVKNAEEVLEGLGYEPFDPVLTGKMLFERLQKSKRAVKTLLLDQSILAGVGNIYSDEALFLAKIHPLTPGSTITEEESGRLLFAVREVLSEGIKRNGASIDWVYRGGDFQNHFNVYQRTGEPCLVCGSPIERRVIGQRSSHYCPHCQPIKN